MYNKLFKGISASGDGKSDIFPFFMALRRELKIWKFGVFILSCVVVLIICMPYFQNNNVDDSDNYITTNQIKYLPHDVIAKISIDSEIIEDKEREKMFEEILKSQKIKGLFVVINSGGGSPNASEILYNYLKILRERYPVFVFIKEIGASGAYMAAIGGSKIFAMPTSLVGSIGIKFNSGRFDFSEILKRNHIGYEAYASSKYKAMGDMFKKIEDTEREYFADTIAQGYAIFKQMVARERKFNQNDLERVANAKIFYGEKALKYGLVDFLSTQDEALNMLKSEIKIEDVKIQEVVPEQKKVENILPRFLQSFSSFFSSFKGPKIMALTHL